MVDLPHYGRAVQFRELPERDAGQPCAAQVAGAEVRDVDQAFGHGALGECGVLFGHVRPRFQLPAMLSPAICQL